ncbi:metal ABC transporter permease [Candidatus Aerophobetes bacterium]|nr:metal ABC transporter permease [Candidatus Aerophobetes bacterium]
MITLFKYEFMRNALIAGVLVSFICGIMGVYVITKRIVFISGGIAHSSFGGIGLGYLLGINPVLGALFFSLFSALSIGIIKRKTKLYEDTAIGIIWAMGMSLGIIFVGLSRGFTPDLFGFLFGNILSVNLSDIASIISLSTGVLLIIMLFFKELLIISFDEEFGEVIGVPVDYLYFLFLCLVAITVIVLMKVVGIILVIALLTIPAATSSLLTKNIKKMMLASILINILSVVLGLPLSYLLDAPCGATIVLLSGAIFLLVFLFKSYVL